MNYIKQHFFSEGFPYQANTFNTDSSFFVAEKLWGPLGILSIFKGQFWTANQCLFKVLEPPSQAFNEQKVLCLVMHLNKSACLEQHCSLAARRC